MTAHSSLSRQGSSIVAFPSKIAWQTNYLRFNSETEMNENLDCFLEEQDTIMIVLGNVPLVGAQGGEQEQ